MTRFLVIDDSKLENIEYELAAPIVYYRRGQREFLASDDGGFMLPNVVYGKASMAIRNHFMSGQWSP